MKRPAAAAAGRYYVDPVAFTKLFRQRRRNHAEICKALQLIANGVAARFWFRCVDDRREHAANALVNAIERIDRFKPSRDHNAFSYYSKLLFNQIVKEIGRDRRRDGRTTLFCDVKDMPPEEGDRPPTLMPRCVQNAKPYSLAV